MVDFYQGMGQEDYNALLKDGERLYVPDHAAMAWMKLGPTSLGIPATAHLTTGSDGTTVWQLVPVAENIAAHWSYSIQPSRHGPPVVLRVPRNNKGLYYACGINELRTLEQETDFRLLMAQAGLDGRDEEGES